MGTPNRLPDQGALIPANRLRGSPSQPRRSTITTDRNLAHRIEIHADGSSLGNPGPSAWAFVLRWFEDDREVFRYEGTGGEDHSTNGRQEIMAALKGLEVADRLTVHCPDVPIVIRVDSQFVAYGGSRWLPGWERRGWIKSDGKPVAHADLWQAIDAIVSRRTTEWRWVRGHNGDPKNEEVDRMAQAEARRVAERMVQGTPAAA